MRAMAEVTNLKQRIQIKIFLDKGTFSDVEGCKGVLILVSLQRKFFVAQLVFKNLIV